MSIARHHAEWLSLLEVSGPFVTMPVLLRVFPQGLDAHDSALHHLLRLAYEEWADNQAGLRPDPAIHTQWVRWVLGNVLEIPAETLVEGQTLPPALSATFGDHGETLRPDLALLDPTNDRPRLLIRYYPPAQDLDKPLPGLLWKATPATRMMELLRATDVRLGLVTNGERWLLVDAPRQETTGFASWYANLWLEEPLTLRALRSLLGVRRFFGVAERDTIEAMLKESATNQQDVTDQLGYQVRRAVEMLVGALDGVDKDYGRRLLAGLPTTELYEAAVTVMMRLVFLLSAEERELLLLGDPLYDQFYAASTLRVQLHEQADVAGEDVLERRHDAWSRLLALFRVVYGGVEHPDLRLPAYGGRLFDPDRFPFLEGRAPGTSWLDTRAAPVQINNRVVLHLLDALQLLQVKVPGGGPAEARRLSFRSLDIEQIGHVYEGLLDHTARRATSPVLGLVGPLANEPEVELERLEQFFNADERGLAQMNADDFIGDVSDGERMADTDNDTHQESIRVHPEHPRSSALKNLPDPSPALLTFLEEQTGKKAAAIKKLLDYQPTLFEQERLRRVCDNDEALFRRVLPWLGLVRLDTFGLPVVITAGSVYVTQGSDRRSTGTHYTPRSLTEPIVQHALDPLVYDGPAQGRPKDQWRLRSADDILALTVCDMAMGSGAFLVQACRYLAEKLVEAWDSEPLFNADEHGLAQMNGDDSFIFNADERGLAQMNGDDFIGGDSDRESTADTDNDTHQESIGVHPEHPRSSALKNLPVPHQASIGVHPEHPRSSALKNPSPNPDPEERLALARRLVSERCLYGVDKNPMAVEMAKLSLWLITLDRGRPFTFLDHALRHGDSLLGVSLRQLRTFSMDGQTARLEGGRQAHFIEQALDNALGTALRLRHSISHLPDRDARDTAAKAARLKEADEVTAFIRLGADLLVAYALKGGSVPSDLQFRFSTLASAFEDAARQGFTDEGRAEARAEYDRLRESADAMLRDRAGQPRQPFHWPLEFPEIFAATRDEAGFHALIGNPPFQGGQKITGALGTDYRDYLVKFLAKGKRGSADLCAYFFLRAGDIVREGGDAALIATNTIAQGDTREVGLEQLVAAGWSIPRAISSRKWPGVAALEIAEIWLRRGNWPQNFLLDGLEVAGITPFLTAPGAVEGKSYQLMANDDKSFQGSIILGMGFVLEPAEAQALIKKDPRNKDVLFPYLNGEDLNSQPDQSPTRWVINFFDWSLEKAETYPDCITIVREKVKPEREAGTKFARKEWWLYQANRPNLYKTVKGMRRVLVIALTSRTCAFTFVPNDMVFSHMSGVFAFERDGYLAILQSSLHTCWAFKYASSLKGDLRYTPSDVFETFPFPEGMLEPDDPKSKIQNPKLAALEAIGEAYYNHRQGIMTARQEGLTKTYNRFHNPAEGSAEVARLRELHAEMDRAVALAYGWSDLELGHDFHPTKQGLRYTISEAARREVLGRLLRLNHARYAAELAAGLHDKGKKGKGKRGILNADERGLARMDTDGSLLGSSTEESTAAGDNDTHQESIGVHPEHPRSSALKNSFALNADERGWARMNGDDALLGDSGGQSTADGDNDTNKEAIRVHPEHPRSSALKNLPIPAQPTLFEVEPVGVAWLGSVVTVREEGEPDGATETYVLISQAEAGRGVREKGGVPTLSIGTPLGMRLLDRKAGDRVRYKGQDGRQVEFVVVRIQNADHR